MKTKTAMSIVAIAAITGVASADSINLEYLGAGEGRNVRVSLDGDSSRVFAGQLRHAATNSVGPAVESLEGQTLLTYCTDLEQNVANNSTVYNVVAVATLPDPDNTNAPGGMGAVRAAAVQSLYAFSNDQGGEHRSATADQDYAAAFQLALWEIIYDYDGTAGSLDVTSGLFSATRTNGNALWSSVGNILASFFTTGVIFDTSADGVIGLSSNTNQDQLVETVTVIPTPAAAAMGLFGLGAIAARRRR